MTALYFIGYVKIELDLNEQQKRINALEKATETVAPLFNNPGKFVTVLNFRLNFVTKQYSPVVLLHELILATIFIKLLKTKRKTRVHFFIS